MAKYVLFLSSLSNVSNVSNGTEGYGYWLGKDYMFRGELFPCASARISDKTKVYTSEARARRALEAAMERPYSYVQRGWIEALEDE